MISYSKYKNHLKSLICGISAAVTGLSAIPLSTANAGSEGFELKYTINGDTAVVSGYKGKASVLIIPSEFSGFTVTGIADSAFTECEGLTAVIIPNTVTDIEENAFSACPDLVSVNIGSGVSRIGSYAFSACPKLSVFVIDSGNTAFTCDNGFLIENETSTLLSYGGSSKDIIINGVKNIAPGAFAGKLDIISANIGEDVTSVGDNAFSGCLSLRTLTIDDKVTNIGESCFAGCNSLKKANLSKDTETIPANCFSGCSALKEFIIPQNVSYISDGAFFDCGQLSGIVIPENVKLIGTNAFGKTIDTITGKTVNIEGFSLHGKLNSPAERYAQASEINYKQFKICDANDDGVVNSIDAAYVLRYCSLISSGIEPYFTSYEYSASDLDGNGVINTIDASMILRYSTLLASRPQQNQ